MNYEERANVKTHVNYDIVCNYVYIFWLYVCDVWLDSISVDIWALPVQMAVLYSKLCQREG